MLCEQMRYNMLFRWFLDMDMLEGGFDSSSFSRNRERLLEHQFAAEFFAAVLRRATSGGLMSSEHFSVDGTLIESWASIKSFRPKEEVAVSDGNGWSDFRGKPRRNETHRSVTDPEARLWRKGKGREAKLCFGGHALMENRNGLLVDVAIRTMTGTAERDTALQMLSSVSPPGRRITVAADAGFDTKDFVAACRIRGITAHVARSRDRRRRSTIDHRTTRHRSYWVSLVIRRRIESIFGWLKSVGGLRRSRLRGLRKTQLLAHIAGAAYNLLRIAKISATA